MKNEFIMTFSVIIFIFIPKNKKQVVKIRYATKLSVIFIKLVSFIFKTSFKILFNDDTNIFPILKELLYNVNQNATFFPHENNSILIM